MLDQLPQDVVTIIIDKVPFEEQYNFALVFLDYEHLNDFKEKHDYVEQVYFNLLADVRTIKPMTYKINNKLTLSEWTVKCDIQIKNLTYIPTGALHKIDIWIALYEQKLVGEYVIYITNTVEDDNQTETSRVTFQIRSISTSEFLIMLNVCSSDHNLCTIASGTRFWRRKKEDIMREGYYLGEGNIVHQRRNRIGETEAWYDSGHSVAYANPIGCEYSKYRFGISHVDLKSLLT